MKLPAPSETRPSFARPGTCEICRSQHSNVEERPTDLWSRHHWIRRVVLLGTAIGFQPNCSSALQD